tara:strand:+ start:4909 stop:6063 length:1155 start_codon:yes stop_codon:yes gene_type:complete
MIPTNANNPQHCDPISSNCVIWQGPDIECVNICNGDTISTVVASMANLLCQLQQSIAGGLAFDITLVDQSNLVGPTATTLQQLIQLMIDNIILNQGTGGSPVSADALACSDVFKCKMTIPACFQNLPNSPASFSTTGEGSIEDVLEYLMLNDCDSSTGISTNTSTINQVSARVTALENNPMGEPNPKLFSSGVVRTGVLTPIDVVVQQLDKQFVQLRNASGMPSNLASATSNQPLLTTPVAGSGYKKTIKPTVSNLADSLHNVWTTIDDLRTAVKDIQDNCCNTVQLAIMGGVDKLYTTATACTASLTQAGARTGCTQVWNSTGIQFDVNCKAYTSPYNPSRNTELINGNWYALCGSGSGPTAQYSTTAPHWGAPQSAAGDKCV